jgi:hypothetical protein
MCYGGMHSTMKRPASAFLAILLIIHGSVLAQSFSSGALVDLNTLIVQQVKRMPSGGNYAANRLALIRLQSVAGVEKGKFFMIPDAPYPSFCSGATYLVFVRTLEDLRRRGKIKLDFDTLSALVIRGQRDGEGIWGRWNANGPGTARLFYELGLGRNFTSFEQARPGDFMKILWTDEIGKLERGHSVIYMGCHMEDDIEMVRYWSSNQPGGYGFKDVPRSEIKHAIFSRLEAPQKLARISRVPEIDPYLAGLLQERSSLNEVRKKCGL